MTLRSQIAKSKGANMFSVEPRAAASPGSTGGAAAEKHRGPSGRGGAGAPEKLVRMVVSARKKLIIFEWTNDDFVETKVRRGCSRA